MAQWKSKKKYSFWHSPLVLLVFFCILVLFAYNMIGLIRKERETTKNKVSELNKIDDLRKREADLNKDINKLNTTQGVEESVRDKFQVVKPGEKMVIIVDEQEKKPSTDDTTKDHSFWGFIKRMFSKNE
jgi:cell division protein FtsB